MIFNNGKERPNCSINGCCRRRAKSFSSSLKRGAPRRFRLAETLESNGALGTISWQSVSICTDNTTVSRTSHSRESALVAEQIGVEAVRRIHRDAAKHTFIGATEAWKKTEKGKRPNEVRRG